MVERVNIYRVTKAPRLTNANSQKGPLDATGGDLRDKNTEGRGWLVEKILRHRTRNDVEVELHVDWVGDYEPTWEPRTNIPEERISRYLAKHTEPR